MTDKPKKRFNSRHDLVIDKRRRAVAQLRLRGFTYREIHAGLIEMREIDEKKNKPWSLGLIHSDVKALEVEWTAAAVKDIGEHKGKLIAELDEVKRTGWSNIDLGVVLSAIQQQRQLLGADAPKRTELGGIPGGIPIPVQQVSMLEGIDLAQLNTEQLDALERAVGIIDGLRPSKGGESQAQPA